MNSSDKAAWASVVLAAVAIIVNAWYSYESHTAAQSSTIAKEVLEAEQAKVVSLQERTATQEIALSNALDRVDLYGDIIAAEGGDRLAYISAINKIKETVHAGFLENKLHEIINRFSVDDENAYIKEHLSWPSLTPVEKVGVMLNNDSYIQRIYAIKQAYQMRLNSFMPEIMQIVLTDRDLRVVQIATYVINKTFEDNMIFNAAHCCNLAMDTCVMHPQEARDQFKKAWEVHREKILGRKPKEYRYGKDKNPPHRQMMYLFDPEKPNDIPVLPE